MTSVVHTISTEINIPAPIEAVWAVLTDLAGYAEWNPYLVRVQGRAKAGGVIVVHACSVPGAEPLVQEVEVVSVEPYTMRWEGGLPNRELFKGDHWFVLDAVGCSATRLRHFEHFSGARSAQVMARYGEVIRANFERFNAALVDRCAA